MNKINEIRNEQNDGSQPATHRETKQYTCKNIPFIEEPIQDIIIKASAQA